MTTPFWFNDPTILFNKENILQVWPTQQMTFEAKLNAISRIVIVMSLLGFMFTRNWNLIIIGIITLAIILTLYKLRKQNIVYKKEGFSVNPSMQPSALSPKSMTTNPVTLESVLRSNFHPTTKKNPFGNVLLTDIGDNPNRLAAAPSFNPDVYDEIDSAVKKQTQMLNTGIINTNKQLYGDLKANYDFILLRILGWKMTKVLFRNGFMETCHQERAQDQMAHSHAHKIIIDMFLFKTIKHHKLFFLFLIIIQ